MSVGRKQFSYLISAAVAPRPPPVTASERYIKCQLADVKTDYDRSQNSRNPYYPHPPKKIFHVKLVKKPLPDLH